MVRAPISTCASPRARKFPFPGPVVFHNYEPEVYVAVQRPLGFFRFDKGRHVVTLECVGKEIASAGYDVGVYDLVLERLPDDVGEPADGGIENDAARSGRSPRPSPPEHSSFAAARSQRISTHWSRPPPIARTRSVRLAPSVPTRRPRSRAGRNGTDRRGRPSPDCRRLGPVADRCAGCARGSSACARALR